LTYQLKIVVSIIIFAFVINLLDLFLSKWKGVKPLIRKRWTSSRNVSLFYKVLPSLFYSIAITFLSTLVIQTCVNNHIDLVIATVISFPLFNTLNLLATGSRLSGGPIGEIMKKKHGLEEILISGFFLGIISSIYFYTLGLIIIG
jgi:hypothetical protein